MPKTERYETELVAAFEKGELDSVATKSELAEFKAAALATAIKGLRLAERDGQVAASDPQRIGTSPTRQG